MANPADLDYDETWNGGYYELALQLGARDDARLSTALSALWTAAEAQGCYARMLDGRRQHEPVHCDAESLEARDHLKGIARLEHGLEIVCGVVAVREEEDEKAARRGGHDAETFAVELAVRRFDRAA